jgi:hypothetical protein
MRVYWGQWGHADDGRIVVRKMWQKPARHTANVVFWAHDLTAALRWCRTAQRGHHRWWIELIGEPADRRGMHAG